MKTQTHQEYIKSKISEVVHLRGVESIADLTWEEVEKLHQSFDQQLNNAIKREHSKQYSRPVKESNYEI